MKIKIKRFIDQTGFMPQIIFLPIKRTNSDAGQLCRISSWSCDRVAGLKNGNASGGEKFLNP
jgi:hypothetical protein